MRLVRYKGDGEGAHAHLLNMRLTDDQAQRMLTTAKLYGLVNFPHRDTHVGITFEEGVFHIGPSRWDLAARLC